ncbi:MAG: GDSL-type esterase/lipase family protein [Campylobacterales bacterium]|nr:GDSL-type esterase/lipase family protein [Campylobacterales bacterium]
MNIRQSTIKILIYFTLAGVVFFGVFDLLGKIKPQTQIVTQQEKHQKSRLKMFESLIKQDWNKVLIGDSHFEFYKSSKEYINLGIAGDTTSGVLHRLKPLSIKEVDKLYILIGINDLLAGLKVSDIKSNYLYIVEELSKWDIKNIYFVSLISVANDLPSSDLINSQVEELNQYLQKLAKDRGVNYIDINTDLKDKDYLNTLFTTDGLHLNQKGYEILEKKIVK